MEFEILFAYVVIGTMASSLVYAGSFNALKKIKEKKDPNRPATDMDGSSSEEESDALTTEDAYKFPIYASGALFSLYLVFKYINKDYVGYLINSYFAVAETFAAAKLFSLITKNTVPKDLTPASFSLTLARDSKNLVKTRFNYFDMVNFVIAVGLTAYYIWTKNWIASNIFGVAFTLSAIRLIELDTFNTGWILLAGLFIYDIFFVFGTDVMVTVATKIDAPIKLLWPKSFTPLIPGGPLQFTLLGLGDIVMPGIFVALCLKFDRYNAILKAQRLGASGAAMLRSLKRQPIATSFPKPYFNACFMAYVGGLFTTIVVMHTFKKAQPALLYLSPACSAAPLLLSYIKGQFNDLLAFTTEKEREAPVPKELVTATAGGESIEADDISDGDSALVGKRTRRRRNAGARS